MPTHPTLDCLLKALGEPTRQRLVNLLLDGPLCVCHLQAALREPQVKISKHLAVLREAGLAEVERREQWRVYRLLPPTVAHKALWKAISEALRQEPAFASDRQRLQSLDLKCSTRRSAAKTKGGG